MEDDEWKKFYFCIYKWGEIWDIVSRSREWSQEKPERNEMKYLYTITFTAFSPYYNANFEYQMSVIDKNGNLGQRALLNRIEKYDGRRPSDSITRIECVCYAN